MERENLIVFGAGTIGKEVRRQAEALGHRVLAQFRSTGVYHGGRVAGFGRSSRIVGASFEEFGDLEHLQEVINDLARVVSQERPRFALLAMPSGGDGVFEKQLISLLIQFDIIPITAGKAALANWFGSLEEFMGVMGCDAAVGGGIGIIPKLEQDLMIDDPSPIIGRFVTNATTNYILSGRWRRRPMDMLIQEALDLGYAEPEADGGMPTAHRVFVVEIDDKRKKVVILANKIFRRRIGRILTLEDVHMTPLAEEALDAYTAESARHKYVVYLSTEPFRSPEIDKTASGSIWIDVEGLHVVGGFKHVPADSALDKWVPDGVGNAYEFEQAGNPVLAAGEGAGRGPTARRMLLNMMRIKRSLVARDLQRRSLTLGDALRALPHDPATLPPLELHGHSPGQLAFPEMVDNLDLSLRGRYRD